MASSAKHAVGPADFALIRLIGKGAFGKVLLVRHAKTRRVYAMKIMHKRLLEMRDHVGYSRMEREILAGVNHPFLVGLCFAFQTDTKLYLVMPYMAGGELFAHLNREGALLEDAVRFYAAEMVLALEHLHSLGIVHRDLKHAATASKQASAEAAGAASSDAKEDAKEADSAAAAERVTPGEAIRTAIAEAAVADAEEDGAGRTRTVCGTTEYMAPEMVSGRAYGTSVDWWALGALLYEMLTGRPPFRANDRRRLVTKILHERISMPRFVSKDGHSLLKGLLERNVEARLGCRQSTMFESHGVQDIKQHPWFASVDWAAMEQRAVEPPSAMALTHDADTHWFDESFTSLPADDTWDWEEERRADEEREARKLKEQAAKAKRAAARATKEAAAGRSGAGSPSLSPSPSPRPDAVATGCDEEAGKAADSLGPPEARFRGFSFVYDSYGDDLELAGKQESEPGAGDPGPSLADDVLATLRAGIGASAGGAAAAGALSLQPGEAGAAGAAGTAAAGDDPAAAAATTAAAAAATSTSTAITGAAATADVTEAATSPAASASGLPVTVTPAGARVRKTGGGGRRPSPSQAGFRTGAVLVRLGGKGAATVRVVRGAWSSGTAPAVKEAPVARPLARLAADAPAWQPDDASGW
ncbi:hypothetical protein FNF31_00461 [Cafeteria roenbergensis]|uniref:Protein kinase domain-containing protein n=1 Tax=Cafeteria roenbergensis TaxID=33653 RepID=A0A5A8DXX8_CAFRO|nr:hypothetical protein FNF31_00461 [Cafeteria roenbergensis]